MNNVILYPDGTYHCQACGVELGKGRVDFSFRITNHALCYEHTNLFLDFMDTLTDRIDFDFENNKFFVMNNDI